MDPVLRLDPAVPAVVVPVQASTLPAALVLVGAAVAGGAQIVEWRLDALEVPDVAAVALTGLAAIIDACDGVAVLATFRSVAEGGVGELDDDAYRELLLGLVAGGVAAVDVELSRPAEDASEIARAARAAGVVVVGSSHDFSGVPDDVPVRFAELARRGSDVLKIAVTASTDTEVIALLSDAVTARRDLGRPVVPIAMGPLGTVTRIAGSLWGAPFTFARVGEGSAPGQLTVSDVVLGQRLVSGSPAAGESA